MCPWRISHQLDVELTRLGDSLPCSLWQTLGPPICPGSRPPQPFALLPQTSPQARKAYASALCHRQSTALRGVSFCRAEHHLDLKTACWLRVRFSFASPASSRNADRHRPESAVRLIVQQHTSTSQTPAFAASSGEVNTYGSHD